MIFENKLNNMDANLKNAKIILDLIDEKVYIPEKKEVKIKYTEKDQKDSLILYKNGVLEFDNANIVGERIYYVQNFTSLKKQDIFKKLASIYLEKQNSSSAFYNKIRIIMRGYPEYFPCIIVD